LAVAGVNHDFVTAGRAKRVVALLLVVYLVVIAGGVTGFWYTERSARAADRDARRERCYAGQELVGVIGALIEENSRLLQANFRDLVRARRMRGEPALAEESQELLDRAARATGRVDDIRRIARARPC
jgi:hypothetical protein